MEGEEVAECRGVWVIGALGTEGQGKGQGKMLYEGPNGFEGLRGEDEKEDEEEEEEDKPPTMVDSSEDEFVENREEEESEESEGEEDQLFNLFEVFLTVQGEYFRCQRNTKRIFTVVR